MLRKKQRHFEKETDTALFFEKEMSNALFYEKSPFWGQQPRINTQDSKCLVTQVTFPIESQQHWLNHVMACIAMCQTSPFFAFTTPLFAERLKQFDCSNNDGWGTVPELG